MYSQTCDEYQRIQRFSFFKDDPITNIKTMIENHSYLTFIPKFGSLGGRAIPHWIGGGHAVLINHFDLFNKIT